MKERDIYTRPSVRPRARRTCGRGGSCTWYWSGERFGRARPSPAVLDELRYTTHVTAAVVAGAPGLAIKRRCHLAASTPPRVVVHGAVAPVVARRGVVSRFTSGTNRGLFARAVKQAWRRSRPSRAAFVNVSRFAYPLPVPAECGARRDVTSVTRYIGRPARALAPSRSRARRRSPPSPSPSSAVAVVVESPCLVSASRPRPFRSVSADSARELHFPVVGDRRSRRCNVAVAVAAAALWRHARRVALIEECAHTHTQRTHNRARRTQTRTLSGQRARARSPSVVAVVVVTVLVVVVAVVDPPPSAPLVIIRGRGGEEEKREIARSCVCCVRGEVRCAQSGGRIDLPLVRSRETSEEERAR